MKFSEFLNESKSTIEDDAKEIKKLKALKDDLDDDYDDTFSLKDQQKLTQLLTSFADKHKVKYKDYIKDSKSKSLGEANSVAAAKEINYIDIDDDDEDEVVITIEFNDKDIKKFKAEYFADILDIDLSDSEFSKGKLKVTIKDEDGKIAKKVKNIAKENDIDFD